MTDARPLRADARRDRRGCRVASVGSAAFPA